MASFTKITWIKRDRRDDKAKVRRGRKATKKAKKLAATPGFIVVK